MTDDNELPGSFRRFTKWATTPPQAYGVYFAAVVLVFMLSFFVGTLKPKTTPVGGPPPVTAPRN
ncbi:MAG: hypothetical protein ACM3N5_10955 [Candidatus Eiseniibacteriota bacterium]